MALFKKSTNASIGFIFITVLVDVIGLGIIIPVLPSLVVSLDGGNMSDAAKVGGMLIGAFALMQFLFAPLLGSLSDRFGRKPVLLISLGGLSIDYFIHAVAPDITWLLISRMVAGMMGASFTVATAYIADISTPQNKAKNFGMVGAAFGLGFIIGPGLGGFLGKIDINLPFYVASGISLLNLIYGILVLPESLPVSERRNFFLKEAIPGRSIIFLLRKKEILAMVASFFLVYIASHALQSTWSFYTMLRYDWNEGQVGLSLMFIGIFVVIIQGGLLGKIVNLLGTRKTIIVGFVLWFLGMLFFGLATESIYLYIAAVPYMFGGIASPTVQTVISNQVSRSEQGALQGGLTSLISVSSIVGPLVMTNVFSSFTDDKSLYLPGAPFYLGAILIGVAAVVIFISLRKLSDHDLNKAYGDLKEEPEDEVDMEVNPDSLIQT